MPAINPPPYILPIASTIPISLDRHTEHGIATDIDVVVAASDGNGIYLARLNECDRYPTMKPLWRRTGEYGVAMTLVSRAIWRAGGHLDSAVDFAIVFVMLLLDVCLSLRFQFVHHDITRSTHITSLLSLLTLYSIDPPIHLMVQIQPSALGFAHEPLDFLLFNSLLPIRLSWYHFLSSI